MAIENRRLNGVILFGLLGFCILPWFHIRSGFFRGQWIGDLASDDRTWPGVIQVFLGHWQILPVAVALAIAVFLRQAAPSPKRGKYLAWLGALGILWLVTQGLTIGLRGWSLGFLELAFGDHGGQPAFGAGAISVLIVFTCFIAFGLAEGGALKGDAMVLTAISALILLVVTFIFYPLLSMFVGSFQDFRGNFSSAGFVRNIQDPAIWRLDCLTGGRCGIAWQTVILALSTATSTTLLGLAFALVLTRTSLPFRKALRILSILPIITPPFVIGLALILMLGRTGFVTEAIAAITGVELGRWIYGLPGIWVAQTLSFTPIAFLVLVGVVEGISPSLEEASQTMRAGRWRTFRKVSLPLMAPGLANAFLIGFIESMADFGNPLVLGGNGGVLSTEIFFAVVGAQSDPSRAAVLAIILLCFTLTAFFMQRVWLGKRNFATVTGKADGGRNIPMPKALAIPVCSVVAIWSLFTLAVYGLILFGGFVKVWGLDHTLTLSHYATAFSVSISEGFVFTGVAWDSFWTTMGIALIAAPLTAAVGILAAWLIVRQDFPGKSAFEFGLMMSFAIPGTVIGISYILAFNLPPVQMTGTALILIFCFVFRNMPVGVRGGIAAMAQLDKNLDEASLTLGANSGRTLRKVILPLLRPAVTAALVYSFVRAITSVSAVIFLVSAKYNMATSYIVGLVENGEFGVAIAYSSVLIVVMVCVIVVFQLLVGERRLRRADVSAISKSKRKTRKVAA